MRLICPSCQAQYEVPDDALPPQGRDVQCSNCSHTWFQPYPERDAPSSVNDPVTERLQDTGATDSSDADAGEEVHAPPPSKSRRALDPDVADVLRQEAKRERQARLEETPVGLESQPDLGLDDAPGTMPPPDHPAKPQAPTAVTQASSPGPRSSALPDITEINSTLRSDTDRSPDTDPGQTAQIEARERRGFRRGFVLMLLICAALALVYAYAPEIAQALPESDPWLSAYVAQVDEGRMWLDAQLKLILAWLDTVMASGAQ